MKRAAARHQREGWVLGLCYQGPSTSARGRQPGASHASPELPLCMRARGASGPVPNIAAGVRGTSWTGASEGRSPRVGDAKRGSYSLASQGAAALRWRHGWRVRVRVDQDGH